jgi:hypothetical protein
LAFIFVNVGKTTSKKGKRDYFHGWVLFGNKFLETFFLGKKSLSVAGFQENL